MCEQCCAKTEDYGEIFPGWYLVRATVNGMEMLTGQWGLVRTNDPEFIWTDDPTPIGDLNERCDKLGDEDEGTPEYDEAFDAWFAWMNKAKDFGKFFQVDPDMGWRLVEEGRKVGYEPSAKPFYEWFYDYLGVWIQNHAPSKPSSQRDFRPK